MRADSGFFDQKLLSFLEEREVSYIVVARLSPQIKRQLCEVREWIAVEGGIYEISSFGMKLAGWDKESCFVVLRERIQEGKDAVGRKLIDVPGYTYRVWVTNRWAPVPEIWRD